MNNVRRPIIAIRGTVFRLTFVAVLSLICAPFVHADDKSIIRSSGDILSIAMPIGVLAYTLLNDGDYQDSKDFSVEFATNMAITHSLKLWVDERRPSGGHYSFPSGHTASAFGGAAFVETRYGLAWGIPAYVMASYVGWTRVEVKAHWPHDVLAGAAIAVAVNKSFDLRRRDQTGKFMFVPSYSDGRLNLFGEWKF